MMFKMILQYLASMVVLVINGAAAAPVLDNLGHGIAINNLAGRSSNPPCTADDRLAREILLEMHNGERSWHHAPSLVWNDTLAAYAQDWANQCTANHSAGPYGENLYGFGPASSVYDWHEQTRYAMHAWIGEVFYFPWHKPDFTEQSGHFSQVIWKSTTKVGCAWNTEPCGNGMAWLFCEFDPPGNVLGAFVENTLPH